MITTGLSTALNTWPISSATKTEVVNVVSGGTCADLSDFPSPNLSAIGANLHGTPVVCGGWGGTDLATYYQSCYKFTINGWQNFTSMKEKRWAAAGVMYNDRFHVFGGVDGSRANIRLKTSELISIDGVVEYGPELPTAVAFHVITSINSTVSILSGGMISATYASPLTWYFNHETGAFSTGPNLMEGRNRHGSATCVDKVTEEKIPIVTAGEGNNYVDLDSTELLINEQWQPGPALPKALRGPSMLQINGDVFLFGGTNDANVYSAIYQLSCSSGTCSWATLNQGLKVERSFSVGIPVPDSLCVQS